MQWRWKKQKKRQNNTGASSYSCTKVKLRNLLTNISCKRLNKNDHTNISFVVECVLLIEQYLNPFSLGKKFISQTDQHYVNMVWERSKPKSLYKFICREENIMLSNQLDVTYQKPSKIVNEYVYYKKKTVELRQCFKEYQLIYQYVYSLLFPRIGPLYCFQ